MKQSIHRARKERDQSKKKSDDARLDPRSTDETIGERDMNEEFYDDKRDEDDEDEKTLPKQTFSISLVLRTECADRVDEDEVHEWLEEQFAGCDMGAIEIAKISEGAPEDDDEE